MSVSPTAVVYLCICAISLFGIVYSSDVVFNLTDVFIYQFGCCSIALVMNILLYPTCWSSDVQQQPHT